jgi:hypothetical protein
MFKQLIQPSITTAFTYSVLCLIIKVTATTQSMLHLVLLVTRTSQSINFLISTKYLLPAFDFIDLFKIIFFSFESAIDSL